MSIVPIGPAGVARLALGLGSLLAGGVLAGCGHASGAGSSPTPTPDAYQQALKFSQCMRSHGIANFPDPQQNGNGEGISLRVNANGGDTGLNPDSKQFQDAQTACQQYLPNGGQLSPDQQAQAQQNALKFAQCMRAHGVDVPDPQPGSGGLPIRIGTGNGKVNPDDPKFQAAQQACQSVLGNPGGSFQTSKGG